MIEFYQRQPTATRNLERQFNLVLLRFLTEQTFIIVVAATAKITLKFIYMALMLLFSYYFVLVCYFIRQKYVF